MDTSISPENMPAEFVSEILKILIIGVPQSIAGSFWFLVTTIWNAFGVYILIFLFLWTVWELVTRNGGFHYNSENGFSPTYNRFVGSGFFLLFQTGTYTILTKLFGHEIYVHVWPYPIHIFAFLATGLFLNLVGFWKYWKLPNL